MIPEYQGRYLALRSKTQGARRSKNYRLILKAIGEGRHRWIDIKRAVEAWSGRPIANPNLTRALKTLMKLGIVRRMDGMYRIEDPIIREVVRGY